MSDRVYKGQKLNIAAQDWNDVRDVTRAAKARGLGNFLSEEKVFERGTGIVNILNNSSTNLDRFAVLGITGVAINPTENADEFKRQPTLTGGTPSTSSQMGKFVILANPLKAGDAGKAFAFGV